MARAVRRRMHLSVAANDLAKPACFSSIWIGAYTLILRLLRRTLDIVGIHGANGAFCNVTSEDSFIAGTLEIRRTVPTRIIRPTGTVGAAAAVGIDTVVKLQILCFHITRGGREGLFFRGTNEARRDAIFHLAKGRLEQRRGSCAKEGIAFLGLADPHPIRTAFALDVGRTLTLVDAAAAVTVLTK